MRSRASIANHPLHPAMVAVPIGAFFLALLADLGFLSDGRPFWAEMSLIALCVGIVTALIAAVLGFIDFTGLPAGSRVRGIAVYHMLINVASVLLYTVSAYLRYSFGPPYSPSTIAMGASFFALAILLVGGWLGGKMVFELRAGVVEPADLVPRVRV
jgi:uncharacterized membrane protein